MARLVQIGAFYRDNRPDGVSLVLSQMTFGRERWDALVPTLLEALQGSIQWHYQQPSLNAALDDTLSQLRAHIPLYNEFIYGLRQRPASKEPTFRQYDEEGMKRIIHFAVIFFTNIYALEQFGRLKPDNWNGMQFGYIE